MVRVLAHGALCLSKPKHNGKSGTAQTVQIRPVLNFYYRLQFLEVVHTLGVYETVIPHCYTLPFFISWVRAPIVTITKTIKLVVVVFPLSMQH